ncbi:MAG: hypothetical protein A3B67_18240 [Burkholderiales bacterium RIFCSPHIGHO2_02_FULL_66_10]|nr:MAG: hypothetical protein A3B67_18240 [Burkholderiales bacterium RIFCSPHIGHO2_02_FULL_66_10]
MDVASVMDRHVRQRTDDALTDAHLGPPYPGLQPMGPCTCCGCIDRAHFPRAAFTTAESQNTMLRLTKDLQALAIGEVREPCFDDGADSHRCCS